MTSSPLLRLLTLLLLFAAVTAPAQDRAQQCRLAAATRLSVPATAIQTTTGAKSAAGNLYINWTAQNGADVLQGYCEVSLSGRVINLQISGPPAPASDPNVAAPPGAGPAAQPSAAYEQACRSEAGTRTQLYPDTITTELAGPISSRTRVAWKSDSGRAGFCVLDANFSMTDFQETPKGNSTAPARVRGGEPGYGSPYGPYGPYYNPYRDPYYNDGYYGGAISGYRRVRVDTAGQGTFDGLGQNGPITRGAVDTQSSRSTVSLSGNGFRVNLYGYIVRSDADRDLVLRITGTDRGNATGSANIRLSDDRSEVESISVNGRLQTGALFSGSFTR